MAYIMLLLVIPVFEVQCPGFALTWTAYDLATGSEGNVSGDLARMDGINQLQWENSAAADTPEDPMVLAIPILAALVVLMLLARSRSGANTLLAILFGFFAYFSTIGFKLERELDSAMSQAAGESAGGSLFGSRQLDLAESMIEDAVGRTPWWWLGWVAVIVALILVNLPGSGRRT